MAGDLQAKYSKLAQEYSKLRAQNQVLKKAVVDEQASSTALKDQVKQREQSLRKAEQEMDSLSFRNQQLTRRVELLQEELSASEARVGGRRTKGKGDSPSQQGQTQIVFDEDLQKKIEENERLHIQFYEAGEQHQRQLSQLEALVEELQQERERVEAQLEGLRARCALGEDRLAQETARLELKAHTLEREARECRARAEECQQQLSGCQVELSRQVQENSSVIQEKVPFNDTQYHHFNSLNVPPHNRRHQLKARDVAGQAVLLVKDLVAALLNFHSYTEQRLHIHPLDSSIQPISPLNQRFSQYLHENAAYVRPLEDGLLQLHHSITEDTVTVLETVVKLKEFADHFSSYTHFLQKILPYQLKSLQEECEASLCPPALSSKNQDLQRDLTRVTAIFLKLQSYITLLALPSQREQALPQSSCSAAFTQLAAALHSLHDALQELSQHYSQKASLEEGLPSVSQKLRTTSECLLSSLSSLTITSSKVATFFSNNLDFFTASPGYGPRGGACTLSPLQAESMLGNKRRAAAYMLTIRKPRPESVPYREALSNRHILTSSTESREGLTQQVHQGQEKIARLEQEKEHWLLEAQLGRVRLEKENQRISELQAQLCSALGGPAPGPPGPPGPGCQEEEEQEEKGAGREATLSTSLQVGMLTTTPINDEVGDEASREQLIKSHYMVRVSELTSQLQLSDSKTVHLHAECRALAKRLAIAEKTREVLAEEVRLANQNITRLQDELSTIKRSYEEQLSMMSDHLCSMNETLSKQREEIDTLKLGNKGSTKKNKGR
ncbi:protein phosphatase 1 regulatory subunit 21 isoform X2 [Osmerus eperlanus]|uniref:protein phosphatase 1 regulatory subunit 21 isoform X2 n=1 Tax=Osmerus eperlanus TaxID=29151 RepID=UPI002E140A62